MRLHRAWVRAKRFARALDAGRDHAIDAFVKATRPREQARASASWADGENLTPRRQPLTVLTFGPEDKLEFLATMSGQPVQFDAWPDEARTIHDLEALASEAAFQRYGVYSQSWVVWRIVPANEAASAAFPHL